jgi:hypothetical protein
MAAKYESIVETVEAIQFVFDTLKDIYMFIGMKDVTYSIKNRVLSGRITDSNDLQVPIAKEDYVVKNSKGGIFVMSKSEFEKKYKIKES